MKNSRLCTTLMSFLVPLLALAQGWPENYGGVMLQGFYWDSYSETTWNQLTAQADELSNYFKLIWVPNSGQTKADEWNSPGNDGYENMGYMPVYWLRHNTCFGTEQELKTMISTFKTKGTGIIEDVVINHKNGLTNWADFPNENVTTSGGTNYSLTWCQPPSGTYTTWTGIWGICRNDELYDNGGVHGDITYVCTSSEDDARNDEGDNFDGCRDLDHTNAQVQENVKTYLKYLTDELGYAGFRYDMVKGYPAYYVGKYNESVHAEYSVGEYWDSKDKVKQWILDTKNYGGYQSAAFDFGLKFSINSAFGASNWSALSDKGNAADTDINRYAVTFVENHDTYRDGNRLNNNVLAANAFILAMPGTPCIFWPHWTAYKRELKKMIKARQAAGVTNQSEITYQGEQSGGYVTKVKGTNGTVLVISGYVTDYDTSGFTLVSAGTVENPNYAFYVSDNVELDLEPMPQVDKPADVYYPSVTVTLSSTKSGSTIVYTTDGTEPTATNGTQVTGSKTLTFNTTTTLKAGILVDGEVINVESYGYTVSNTLLRVYARSEAGSQMYFYTYNGKEVNGSWGDANKIAKTTTVGGKTWYYYDYDTNTYPNLQIIFRDASGHRYPADGADGIELSSLKDNPFVVLSSNTVRYIDEETVKASGTYYWVSPELTNGEKWESFKFQHVRWRDGNGTIDPDLYTFTLNDNQVGNRTINYYVVGVDLEGNKVEYHPYDTYDLAMNQDNWNYDNHPTAYYQSYGNCKQTNNYMFRIYKGNLRDGIGTQIRSYTWSLNTGDWTNVGEGDDRASYDTGQNKWWGRPFGPQSLSLDVNLSISDDSDGFYLFGNLKWEGSEWQWYAAKDDKFKFQRDYTYSDSLIYYVDVNNDGHAFTKMYLQVAPGALLTNNSNVSSWSPNGEWNKTIRFLVQCNRDAMAHEGALYIADQKELGNKNQAFNPTIDTELYDSYRLYINLTASTYRIVFKTSPYIIGDAVGKDFGNVSNAIALTWDDAEECYKYTGTFTKGGEFRFIVNNKSYKLNWGEDDEAAGNSSVDGDYYNRVEYHNNESAVTEGSAGGDRVKFNLATGTYTLRFYMGEGGEDSYYTINRDIPMRNMTYISNASGKLGEITERTRTINGTIYNSATSWADDNAYQKPQDVDIYIVTGLDQSEDVYQVRLRKLDIDYIPANVGVLLFTKMLPSPATDRNYVAQTQGYAQPTATYAGTDNLLRAAISPAFIPHTVVNAANNVETRNFLFGYYRPKPYQDGSVKGNYEYKLGFWRSTVNPDETSHLSSANMAYLALTPEQYGTTTLGIYDSGSDPAAAPYIHFVIEEESLTAIGTPTAAPESQDYYTLQGVKVAKPLTSGVYIHNGKKIIIK